MCAAPVAVENGASIPTALVIAITAIDQKAWTRGIFSDKADPSRVTSGIARDASIRRITQTLVKYTNDHQPLQQGCETR